MIRFGLMAAPLLATAGSRPPTSLDKGFAIALGTTALVTAGTVLFFTITAIPAAAAIARSSSRIVSSGLRMF